MRILIVIGLTIAGLLLGYLFWQISEEGYARTWTRLPDPPGETIELLSAQDPAPYVRASDGSIYRYEERQERDWMEGTVPEGPTSGPIEVQRPCDLSAPEFSILSRPPRDVVDCVQGTVLYADGFMSYTFVLDRNGDLWQSSIIRSAYGSLAALLCFSGLGLGLGFTAGILVMVLIWIRTGKEKHKILSRRNRE